MSQKNLARCGGQCLQYQMAKVLIVYSLDLLSHAANSHAKIGIPYPLNVKLDKYLLSTVMSYFNLMELDFIALMICCWF